MQILPHRVFLMALQGHKELYGRAFLSKEEALAHLRRMTGQDFGYDADKWAKWLGKNWQKCYPRRKP